MSSQTEILIEIKTISEETPSLKSKSCRGIEIPQTIKGLMLLYKMQSLKVMKMIMKLMTTVKTT